jgi:hypothetical protein
MRPWTEELFLLHKLDKRGHHAIPPTCTPDALLSLFKPLSSGSG